MDTIIVDSLMAWVRNEEDCAGNWRDDLPVIAVSMLEQFIKEQPQPTKKQDTEGVIEQLQHKVIEHSYTSIVHDEEIISTGDVLKLIKDTLTHDKQPKTAPVPSSKSYLHSRITKELNAIYIAKNSDYGDAFGETYKKLGIISAVTRITDKVNRLQSLAAKSEEERMVKDESIIDTLLDLTNYSLMTLIEMGYEPPNN